MSSRGNGSGGAGQGTTLMEMNSGSWGFDNLDNDPAGKVVADSDDSNSISSMTGERDRTDRDSATGIDDTSYAEIWTDGDADGNPDWENATDHVEHASDDQVDEIRLGGASSSHQENEGGLD